MVLPNLRSKIRDEFDALIKEGNHISSLYLIANTSDEELQRMLSTNEADVPADPLKAKSKKPANASEIKLKMTKSFDFGNEYQKWYSRALRAIHQVLPERAAEFGNLYRPEKRREMNVETYGIADAIHGLTVTSGGVAMFDTLLVTTRKLRQQVAIVESARESLDMLLSDVQGVIQASLLDDELSAANELLKSGHLRSAGVIGGVVLERHLKSVMDRHKVTTRRKPTLANLNDSLKEAGHVDVPVWRQVQYIADIRNLCAHSGDREPDRDEVEAMLISIDKIVKTIF